MFAFLIDQSLRHRLLVIAASLIVVFYGVITLKQMPVDVFPDLNKPTVTLLAEAGGMAPEEVEQLVTFPIETAMNGMPGVTRVRSVSGHRPCDRLRRVRLGHRDLPQPPAGRRAPVARARAASRRHRAADGADRLDHGRDHADRAAGRSRQGAGDAGPGVRRLGDAPAAAHHPGRRAGDPDRRRGQAVPRRARPRAARSAGRAARGDRVVAQELCRQHERRLPGGRRTRVPHPQYRTHLAPRGPAEPRGRGEERPADPAQAGGRSALRPGGEARGRELQRAARGDPLGAEAAGGGHREAHRRDRSRARRADALAPGRHERAGGDLQAGQLHPGLDRQRRGGAARRRDHGGGGAVPVPAQPPHDAHLAHRHPDVDPDHRAGVQGDGPVHQHHDPGRARDRHRRAGGRRGRGPGEHPAAAQAQRRARARSGRRWG